MAWSGYVYKFGFMLWRTFEMEEICVQYRTVLVVLLDPHILLF